MKRLQKYTVIFGTAMLCAGFSACSKQPDFDAKSYVQSSLDAQYHGEYTDYANLLEISEEDAKKEIEEDGGYTVSVQVEPSDVFQTLQQSSTEVSNEKIKQGLDGSDP